MFPPNPLFPPTPFTPWIVLAALWTIPWKGWALWKSARTGSKPWFVALLIINTLGVLEILYIYVLSKEPAKPAAKPEEKK